MASNFKYVVLNSLADSFGGKDMTHETVVVTKTATMTSGSLLVGAVEAAAADAATVDGIIDDAKIEVASVGDVVAVSVAKRNVKVAGSALTFSDAAYGAEALAALETVIVA
jgi:hypothetical protein